MSKLVTDNTFDVRDVRGVLILTGDLVAFATPDDIKVGTVIGFRENKTQCNSYTRSLARVVVECSNSYKPSTIIYPTRKVLCIKKVAQDLL